MKATFCPRCGTKLGTIVEEGRELGKCTADGCPFVDYDSPLAVGVGLIESEGGVVLVQRALRPVGKWCLPAGFINTGESPKEGTEREVGEESGLIVVVPELPFAIRKVPNGNQFLMFFLASKTGGQMQPGSDALDVKVFPPDALPEMAFPLHTQVIAEHFAGKAQRK
ncbi:MAG TPA: NUDIX domain-containing protein [Planktothrix sp.]|jgi:ADP-ribose pyrophosphatase YjhB (NUDIX family)